MKTILIGADCEENLGMGMIAAAIRRAGHRVTVLGFEDPVAIEEVAEEVLSRRPHLVGLAIQFQHGALAHVRLARRLRELGYAGHITCGGQHPTMAYRELLADISALDSVVLHEGEETIVELLAALASGQKLDGIAGLAFRGNDGIPKRTAPRALSNSLDALPFAHRYRPHLLHLGVPFIPIWGSRGCWGSCAFCAITTAHRAAKRQAPSRLLRLRSVENLASEMAALWHRADGQGIFCFHDDTLLLPRPEDSLERLRSLRRALDELGVGEIGIVGKCRPDCVTPELALALRRLGVFRMFVGIENGCQAGLDHLNRRTTTEDLNRALAAFADAGIYTCFNLLLFEPDARLEHLRENIAFMRAHAEFPVNFCRAEAYHGTPLHQRLLERGALIGNYLGWDYRIADDRTELAFRMTAAVFRERNFDPLGVANRYIGVAYLAQLLKTFFDCSGPEARRVLQQTRELVMAVTRESAYYLERILELAERADLADPDTTVRLTAQLGLELSACNRHWHAELDELETAIRRCAEQNKKQRMPVGLPERARALFQQLAVAGCLVTSLPGCGGATDDEDNQPTAGGASGELAGATATGGRAAGGSTGTAVASVSGGRSSSSGQIGDGGTLSGGRQATTYVTDPGGTYWTSSVIASGGASVGSSGPSGGSATGGRVVDPGGTTASGGRAMGGWVVDRGGTSPNGGRATGGWIGDGGVPPAAGRSTGGVGARASTGGTAFGGRTVVDPAPLGGRGLGGLVGDGGSPPLGGRITAGNAGIAGIAGLHASHDVSTSSALVLNAAGFVGDPAITCGALPRQEPSEAPPLVVSAFANAIEDTCRDRAAEVNRGDGVATVVDPPPPPRTAAVSEQARSAAFEPTEHWRNTQIRHFPRSQDLPLWDPPEVTLRARAVGGTIDLALCSSDACISARWQGEGTIQQTDTGARWRPESPDDQISVCVRSEGGIAFATCRAANVPGFEFG